MTERYFPRYPFYATAKRGAVDEIDCASLTHERFTRDYVRKNKPCLIKGAIAHWPAVRKWSRESLAASSKDRKDLEVEVSDAPFAREFPAWDSLERGESLRKRDVRTRSLGEMFDLLAQDRYTVARVLLRQMGPSVAADVGSFTFQSMNRRHGTAFYPSKVAYLYRNCFTDWHFHYGSEALMTQAVGVKEVLLLGPTDREWNAIAPVLQEAPWSYEAPASSWAGLRGTEPLLVRIEAGDALFIPCWWWHVVEAVDDAFGATIPHFWDAEPLTRFNPRYPGVEYMLFQLLPAAVMNRIEWSKFPRQQLKRSALFLGIGASVGAPMRLAARLLFDRRSPWRPPTLPAS